MPQINRIRVNNVKYNFGTQAYDDFVMKPFCGNTLYDLANGGGKSVLMLLLLQNVIPNCTLDEKQPIEKLFRLGEGSKTIHSLVEWRLDDEDVKNGFRYMTTGFCAKKAAESEEESRDVASIEYFNYCIFYRDYNANDICNLPLVREKERITYSGLRRYLRELEKDASLVVRVFDRKGEYQAFLSEYGIYESAWEIVRGINKTEGHVRTYFETNYKTTRKVVEDLLIEEIIGTSIRRKAGREETEDLMSKTLLSMKDKLVELAKQKDAIKNFDREEEVLTEFSSRVEYLGSIYREQSGLRTQLKRIYNAAEYYCSGCETEAAQKREAAEQLAAELLACEAELLCAALSKDRALAKEYRQEAEQLEETTRQRKERQKELAELLLQKECANDYLAYQEEKQKRDRLAVTLTAMTEKSGLQGEIAALVRRFAVEKERKEAELTAKLQRAQEEENAALTRVETAENTGREVERELSVTKVLAEQGKKELAALQQALKDKKDTLGLLLSEDAPMQCYRKTEQKARLEKKRAGLREERETALQEKEELLHTIAATENELARLLEAQERKQSAEERMLSEKARADKLCEAYGEKDYRALRENVRKRCRESFLEKERLRGEREGAKARRLALEAGNLFVSNAAAETVKDYIITRYRKGAVTGAEYLAERTGEEQKELLTAFSGLPFAVITEGFSEAAQDHLLPECLPEGVVVPVVRIESLRGGKELFHRDQLRLFARDGATLLSEKERTREIARLARVEEETEYKLNRLDSLSEAYEEDEEFLTGFVKEYYAQLYAKTAEYGTEAAEREKLNERLAALQQRLAELSGRLPEISSEEEECLGQLQECEEEIRSYRAVEKLFAEANEREKLLLEYEEKQKRLLSWQTDAETVKERAEGEYHEKQSVCEALRRSLAELAQAMESYAIYQSEGEPAACDLPLSELMSEIDGKIVALHAETSSLEDKQRLLDSYVSSMNHCLRTIRSKGQSVADLAALQEKNELSETPEEELLRRREELRLLAEETGALEKKLSELSEKQYRMEGKNSRAEEMIVEKYGEYRPVELSGAALEDFVTRRRMLMEQKKQEQEALQKEQEALGQELAGFVQIRNETGRLLEDGEPVSEECGRLENKVRLQECFRETREKYAGCAKELMKRQEEFYRNRQTTMETLQLLGAQELAAEIGGSIAMPKGIRETEEIIRGLGEVIECLRLERSRIEAGLGDLEMMKENFEEQCLQRCINIKADLERLPKLSRIMLNGEQIPVLSLQIPYVKEEFFRERMTQYIDRVIREVDEITGQTERMKYIKSALSYKQLFSVIVTDMNAIRLLLYKRERIREQSRMLRYEEAVGSTGQSQGIYIQFLIAIINYISSIHSPKGDAAGLRKVIFLDNPFGAAKDVYIWEPIFELLRANHVQLIVPARGATPAITGRFDVNYVLGQKLIDGRQQTVVVDYCSRVETEGVEYIPLQYEQTSLDISEV